MTTEDDALLDAITDQINAEIAAAGYNMKSFAEKLGRPYDSTRNYLRKERPMPILFLLESASALDLAADEIIGRARQRIRQ